MKILSLKYKIHKLVNLVFYLIIFGIGFMLGFGAEKININKLMSQFLFIDNVSAEELFCTESENLFVIEDVSSINSTNPATISTNGNKLIISGKIWYYANYDIVLEPGTYTFNIDEISGGHNAMQMRKIIKNENGSITEEWLGGLYPLTPQTFEFTEQTHIQFRFYTSMTSGVNHATTTYTNFTIKGQVCEKEVMVEIVNDTFYSFAQKIFGEVDEENYFVYDFITLGLVVSCFTLFVLLVGFIIKKFFGG